MDQLTTIGLLAGLITTLGFVPQVVKGYRSGRMEDVSLVMPAVLMVGMGLWLVYGIFLDDLPIILWNAVSIALNAVMMFLKLRSDRRKRKGTDLQLTH